MNQNPTEPPVVNQQAWQSLGLAWQSLGLQMLSLTQREKPDLSEDQARSRVLAALLILLGDLTPSEASTIRLQQLVQSRHGLEVTA